MIRDSRQCYCLSGRKKGHKPNEINDLLDPFSIKQILQNLKERIELSQYLDLCQIFPASVIGTHIHIETHRSL